MTGVLDRLSVWQTYPALILSGFAPWIAPFLRLRIINQNWKPDIDIVMNGLVVLYVTWLLLRKTDKQSPAFLRRSFFRSIITAACAAVFCYITYRRLIHLIDPDWAFVLELLWAFAYAFLFLALTRAVFTGLCGIGK